MFRELRATKGGTMKQFVSMYLNLRVWVFDAISVISKLSDAWIVRESTGEVLYRPVHFCSVAWAGNAGLRRGRIISLEYSCQRTSLIWFCRQSIYLLIRSARRGGSSKGETFRIIAFGSRSSFFSANGDVDHSSTSTSRRNGSGSG